MKLLGGCVAWQLLKLIHSWPQIPMSSNDRQDPMQEAKSWLGQWTASCASHDSAQAVVMVLGAQRGLLEFTFYVVVGLLGGESRHVMVWPALNVIPNWNG